MDEPGDADPTIVTFRAVATDGDRAAAVLSRYVVLSRGHPGCVNIDLCRSAGQPDVFVVIEKWATPTTQRAHLDSDDMVTMATELRDVLAEPPAFELLDPISVHDLI